jgi:hypothetical protein
MPLGPSRVLSGRLLVAPALLLALALLVGCAPFGGPASPPIAHHPTATATAMLVPVLPPVRQ